MNNKNVLLRIDKELYQLIEELAESQERSVNKQLVYMIKQSLNSPFLGGK